MRSVWKPVSEVYCITSPCPKMWKNQVTGETVISETDPSQKFSAYPKEVLDRLKRKEAGIGFAALVILGTGIYWYKNRKKDGK